MEQLRILVVHDHLLFRQGLEWILAQDSDMHVVGAAGTVAGAIDAVARLRPDMVLCDLHLPDGDGLTLTRQLRRRYPLIRVVIVTLQLEEETILGALRAGVAAFLTKDTADAAMLATLRSVGRGEYPINAGVLEYPGVAESLLDQYRNLAVMADTPPYPVAPLTPRELEVLAAAAEGQVNKQIGLSLGISDQTVKNHMTMILRKLAVHDRTQAVIHARRRGWLSLDEGDSVRQR